MKLIEIRNQFHMLTMELTINGLLEQKKLKKRYRLQLSEISEWIQKFTDLYLI
jgi:hypothetical protein